MILFKALRLRKFRSEIHRLCKDNSYDITEASSKAFTVKTPNKIYNITILSTYRFKNSGITFISDKELLLWSNIILLRSISFPLYKRVNLTAAKSSENEENIFVVFPKCLTLQIVEPENRHSAWTLGKKLGSIRIFDGASFKDELKNPGLYTEEKESRHSAVIAAIGC